MAENKRSFILYSDYLTTVSKLSDVKAGKLFKVILEYVNDLDPSIDDILLEIAFEPVKQQLKRDLKKWEKYIEKQKFNGSLGGRPKTQITQAFSEEPKKADNVNVTVNVNDNVNVTKRERAFAPPTKEEVTDYLISKNLDDFTAMAEAEKFINFYESKNWFVGKNKMKKWDAAAAGWISRMKNFNHGTHRQTFSSKQGTAIEQNDAADKW